MKIQTTLLLLIVAVRPAWAQGPPPPPPLNEVPLDGFSTALLAAGVGYGMRKALRRKKTDSEQ